MTDYSLAINVFSAILHRYFKTGNVLCRIVSDTSLFMLHTMSMAYPSHIHVIFGHHRFSDKAQMHLCSTWGSEKHVSMYLRIASMKSAKRSLS